MDSADKHIDRLILQRALKQSELEDLGQEISKSSHEIIVLFVDLADSTAMKADSDPDEWLGKVYEFIRRTDQLAQLAQGTVVKRIGDEVMITFRATADSDRFIASVKADATLAKYRFKIAADAGKAFHFKFLPNLEDDPYGPVVDRCARISKLAKAGALLCSKDYFSKVQEQKGYVSVGSYTLKGFREPTELYAYALAELDVNLYGKELLSHINEDSKMLMGYKTTAQLLTVALLREMSNAYAKPFLARELLNVPKLPYSPKAYIAARESAVDRDEFERGVIGYIVEWKLPLKEIKREADEIALRLILDAYQNVRVRLPRQYWETLRDLKVGQEVTVRGVIQRVSIAIELNYADITYQT